MAGVFLIFSRALWAHIGQEKMKGCLRVRLMKNPNIPKIKHEEYSKRDIPQTDCYVEPEHA
jgi:hypothetical protein